MTAHNPPISLTWSTEDNGESFTAVHDGQTWLLWRKPAWEGKRGYAKRSSWHLAPLLGESNYDDERCRYIAPHRKSDLPRAKMLAAWILANPAFAAQHHLGDIEKAALL